MAYTNLLNIKSPYNFLSSAVKTDAYFNFLKQQQFQHAFLIDTNIMYYTLDFYLSAKKHGFIPVLGVELTFETFNIIVVAKNNDGYKVLTKVCSHYNLHSEQQKILDLIFSGNDIAVVMIPKSEMWQQSATQAQLLKHGFYLGITKKNAVFLQQVAFEKKVFADKVESLHQSDYEFLKIMNAIKNGLKLSEVTMLENNYYLQSEEVANYIPLELHEANMNTLLSEIEPDSIIFSQPQMPVFHNKDNLPSKSLLQAMCSESLMSMVEKKIIDSIALKDYQARMEHELNVITSMNFENYFLVVADFINYARSKNILVGPGRGSAAGSLVSFLLGITRIDPLKYNLLFERFLNKHRVTMPDIDTDFQDDRRQEVIEYLFAKYDLRFATISTFQTIGVKNAIRDCAKALDISEAEISDALKEVDGDAQFDMDQALKHPKMQQLKDCYENLFYYAQFLIMLPRQSGTHAAGVVIGHDELWNTVPLKEGINGVNQIQYTATHLEKIGLIKIDILGLRNLTIIQTILTEISNSRNTQLDLYQIPVDDNDSLELLRHGETNGIFQFESSGMIEALKTIQPSSFADIATVMALYRPGPMELIPEFAARKKKKNIHSGFGPEIDAILQETYGIIVYQEQIMQILQLYAGLSLSKADLARVAISKKNEVALKQFAAEFFEGAQKKGHKAEDATKIWDYIQRFAWYGFNKSHAIAYSQISFWLAYLKTHYKAEFYCVQLNSAQKDTAKVAGIVRELNKLNLTLVSPSIRAAITEYHVHNGKILMPLSAVKGVGVFYVKKISQILKINTELITSKANFFALLEKIYDESLTLEVFSNLIKAGVFDFYGYARSLLLKYNEELLLWSQMVQLTQAYDDFDFDLEDSSVRDNENAIMAFEQETLGISINANPLIKMREANSNISTVTIATLKHDLNNVNVLGRIENISIKTDKNNGEMAFLEFADDTAKIQITVFASVYSELKNTLHLDKYYILAIKTQFYREQTSGVLNRIVKIIEQ